ncbi:MAG: protein kinase family protein [Ruminococcus sp.]|nr:protein kinase family protein [Ruminococcus sp.]
MSVQIQGTKFIYEIDNKDFPDGFIASGTESFVFKGRKISIGEDRKTDLSFSCVLKFKPKSKERLERFKNQELKIFEELQECRSVARIYDVIEDIGEDFELEIPDTKKYIRSSNPSGSKNIVPCFCVVEEFIDGWSLEQFCRREFWGLEKKKDNRWINFHDFTDAEKEEVLERYKDEKTFFRYQEKLLRFMQSLCGILMFISTTSKKKVLHLDIKPENIMVTSQSEELVLIDFGRSVFLPDDETFVRHFLPCVDYDSRESINTPFSHGTIGYAAPECFVGEGYNSKFPFEKNGYETGKMSIESDIFSFGATFWECMNIVELMVNSRDFAESPHDFYEKNLLDDKAYFNRDLSLECTGPLGGRYHLSLQKIIKKCTKRRKLGYLESNDYYHYYSELKDDLDDARDSIPSVKKGENKQVRNAATIFGFCIGCIITLLLFSVVYKAIGYQIATNNWETLMEEIDNHDGNSITYQATQFGKISEIALERMELADDGQKKTVCDECYGYLLEDDSISTMEASLMVSLLEYNDNNSEKMTYVDKIMEKANAAELSTISSAISEMGISEGSTAYNLAAAIHSVENISNYNYNEAYNLLLDNENNPTYANAVRHLAIALNNKGDMVINSISDANGKTRSEIKDFLDSLEKK